MNNKRIIDVYKSVEERKEKIRQPYYQNINLLIHGLKRMNEILSKANPDDFSDNLKILMEKFFEINKRKIIKINSGIINSDMRWLG